MVATAPSAPSSLAGPSAQGRSASKIAPEHRGATEVLPENDVFGRLAQRHPDCRIAASCLGRTRPHRGNSHRERRRFSGQTRSGRYSWARYYHPGLARFISEDPIEFDGGDINLYAYVSNAPTGFVDPFGLEKERRCSFGDRYLQHLDAYLINVGPAATGLLGGLWPKSWAPATGGRGPFLGSTNPLTSVPRAFRGFGIPVVAAAAATTAGQFTAASIGVATVGIGYYNVGVFTSGLAYAAFPGWNGLPPEGCK